MIERGDSISELSAWTLRVNLSFLPDSQLLEARAKRARVKRGIRRMRGSNQRTERNARNVIALARAELRLRVVRLPTSSM
jgi:hypothetical protein